MTLDDIRAAFPRYHLHIDLYPAGGMLDVEGCAECGTDDTKWDSSSWRDGKGGRSLENAILQLQDRLGLRPNVRIHGAAKPSPVE